MSETAQQHLDRKLRDFAPVIEAHAVKAGLKPPYRSHMVSVDMDAQAQMRSALGNAMLHRAAFDRAQHELGVTGALDIMIPDQEARLTWVVAVVGEPT